MKNVAHYLTVKKNVMVGETMPVAYINQVQQLTCVSVEVAIVPKDSRIVKITLYGTWLIFDMLLFISLS